ncbi:MAG: 16S rRNA (guanine(527)-N(7))-methyltransferase RsmG [Fimbriimonadaceae bacterium]
MDRFGLRTTCAEFGIELGDGQLSAFEAFECALYAANRHTNFTRVPQEDCWLRHFVDSLLIAEFLPFGAAVLDIGAGPGFPAWPIACARPDLTVAALDSNGKMVRFLASQKLPNLEVLHARAEDHPPREAFDVVTGRALAPLAVQLELSAAPCRVAGVVLPMRTPNDDPLGQPPPGLGLELRTVHRRRLPTTDIVRVFPEYRKVSSTRANFPRSWAEIRKAR